MRFAVVKLGGHVIFNGLEMDINYVGCLVKELQIALKDFDGLAVVTGGGGIARHYIAWGKALGFREASLDTIGISVSRINATFLWAAFHGILPPNVPLTIGEAIELIRVWKIVFMGGLQPAQSTTTVAALLAEALDAEKLVIATDVDGVYSEDPKKNPAAKKFDKVKIEDLEQMFSKGVEAGGYKLFDPLTLAVIKRSRIPTQVIAGKPPSNIRRTLEGESLGTVVLNQ
ncbi:MAG: UMP kinase [Thermofilaceae archaeon]